MHGIPPYIAASPPSGVTAVQDGPTSIMVSWTPPSPLGDTSGYRIYYTRAGGSSNSVDIDGENTNTHTLMDLTNGGTYTISVAGTSSSSTVLPSPPESAGDVDLGRTEPIIHTTLIPSMCICVWEVRVCYDSVLVMMVPPLFDMRLCFSLSSISSSTG